MKHRDHDSKPNETARRETVPSAPSIASHAAEDPGERSPRLPFASRRAFALVLTLALLALLVLLVMALASLGHVDAQLANTAAYQVQARQNARLALGLALGELQRQAGPDNRVTAMAGVTGVPTGTAGNQRRHWCGVWDTAGGFQSWLVSGAAGAGPPAVVPGAKLVLLVAAGSVGAEATNSEHVAVGRMAIALADPLTDGNREQGGYAYWVGDEGVKICAYAPDATLALPGLRPVLAVTPAVALTLRTNLATWTARLPAILSYEQLRLLPSPGAPLTNSTIWDNFHQVTLTSVSLQNQGPSVVSHSGPVNVNTTSQPVWNALATTYNTYTASVPISNPVTFANRMRDNLPVTGGIGKPVGGPFLSVTAFQAGGILTTALNGLGPTPAQFLAVTAPLLTARSDTFRVRAYGDAVNPADASQTEAVAYAEAIVQRTPQPMDGALGRRFVVTYFRWLGIDDI